MAEARDVDATVQRIEELIEELGETDPRVRDMSAEIIRLLMHLYGSGLARITEIAGPDATSRMAEDKLVSSLLLLHGLHPAPAETRIGDALRKIERRLGYSIRLEAISGDAARIRVEGDGGSPAGPLAGVIERAVAEAAPEIGAVEIEGIPDSAPALVQIAPAVAH